MIRLWAMALILTCAATQATARTVLPSEVRLTEEAPDSFVAVFKTAKGPFAMKARRHWSPRGVDRLYQLVKSGYYDGLTIYRVGETKSVAGGRVVQFGQANDTAAIHAWDRATIPDEPVVWPHRPGAVGFARGGPGTRTVEIAIATNAIPALDTVNYLGVQGFPVIAEVFRGMEVFSRLEGRYGNAPIENDSLSILGGEYLKRVFPGLDSIVSARVVLEWGPPGHRGPNAATSDDDEGLGGPCGPVVRVIDRRTNAIPRELSVHIQPESKRSQERSSWYDGWYVTKAGLFTFPALPAGRYRVTVKGASEWRDTPGWVRPDLPALSREERGKWWDDTQCPQQWRHFKRHSTWVVTSTGCGDTLTMHVRGGRWRQEKPGREVWPGGPRSLPRKPR